MDSSSTNETSKTAIAIITSILVAVTAMCLVSFDVLPAIAIAFIIPTVAYAVSIAMSVIFQFSTCNTIHIGSIAIGNLGVFATNALACFILLLESVPFLKNVFGVYAPRNPLTGEQYAEDSKEYAEGMLNENHYKIQFFSNIVKAVIPSYINEGTKKGIVYLYWTFWMTIVPYYFLLSLQGICAK
jgi:hypothetical protein